MQLITASGEVDGCMKALLHGKDINSFDFILPEIIDVEKAWDTIRHVKLGSRYNWSRSFKDWGIVYKNP